MVIWLIGMSGAGKTTVARRLVEVLREQRPNVVLLDGDLLRDVWGEDVGHSIEGRRLNAHRISHLCQMLDQQGIHIVAAVLSLFPEWQAWNRANFSEYFEVFLDVPLDVLKKRDVKALYAGAEDGTIRDVVGIDIPFPRPPHPDLVIDNRDHLDDPGVLAETIIAVLPNL